MKSLSTFIDTDSDLVYWEIHTLLFGSAYICLHGNLRMGEIESLRTLTKHSILNLFCVCTHLRLRVSFSLQSSLSSTISHTRFQASLVTRLSLSLHANYNNRAQGESLVKRLIPSRTSIYLQVLAATDLEDR